ncbi:Amidohydrolase [Mycobacterium sp. smrl_JER01]|uniref:amidohydrolase family protein n=1 Tax=Mycobacterium sp. smrl_JER01 TaxID=3402633 RepID=UPI003D714DBF
MTTSDNSLAANAWRLATPGDDGWDRTIRPDDPRKLFVVSADCHANEPPTYLLDHIEPVYFPRLPRMERRDDGSEWLITEGTAPMRVKAPASEATRMGSRMEAEDQRRSAAARDIATRLADQQADGVDVELIFPTKGLFGWATPDPVFAMAMCRAWNRWAYETFSSDGWHGGRTLPLASIAAGDLDGALAEVAWAATKGFVGVCLGNSPIYGPKTPGKLEYNDPLFEPLWTAIEDAGLAITFHVSTGRDPRAVTGDGGAVVNYVCHSMETTIEPAVQLIASGVLERHPRLRVGLVESGIGFLPWLLETMDYAYRAHHFFVRPQLPELPSVYFRRQCFATFQEDHAGLAAVEENDLVANVLWANDYPHHEGSWPHSAASVERQMVRLSDDARSKILGLNAARIFGLPVTR